MKTIKATMTVPEAVGEIHVDSFIVNPNTGITTLTMVYTESGSYAGTKTIETSEDINTSLKDLAIVALGKDANLSQVVSED